MLSTICGTRHDRTVRDWTGSDVINLFFAHDYSSKLVDSVEERLGTGPDLPLIYIYIYIYMKGYGRLRTSTIKQNQYTSRSFTFCPKSRQ
jgi:hypothetical protein